MKVAIMNCLQIPPSQKKWCLLWVVLISATLFDSGLMLSRSGQVSNRLQLLQGGKCAGDNAGREAGELEQVRVRVRARQLEQENEELRSSIQSLEAQLVQWKGGKGGLEFDDDVQRIPRQMVQRSSDLYPRRIWGKPDEDLVEAGQPRNLLAVSVGMHHMANVDRMMQKFPAENFTLVLFHYDESSYKEWKQFEWSRRAIHIQVPAQGKWWYAKRFLHPSLLEPYDYIFFWDEDLDLEHLNPVRYVEVMRKHGLEISQPALSLDQNVHHLLTVLNNGTEMHRRINTLVPAKYKNITMCRDGSTEIPCAGFVEGMAPVFSRRAWRCVWHMIQNDLVLGWGLDMKFGACANGPPHENMGIIDSDFVKHLSIPSMGEEDAHWAERQESTTESKKGTRKKSLRLRVRKRSGVEYMEYLRRWQAAENATAEAPES